MERPLVRAFLVRGPTNMSFSDTFYGGGEKERSYALNEQSRKESLYDTVCFSSVGFSSYRNWFFWPRHWLLRLGWTGFIGLSRNIARVGSYNGHVGSMDARLYAVYYRGVSAHRLDLVSGL